MKTQIVFVILLALLSCKRSEVNESEVNSYVNDETHGLRRTIETEGYKIVLCLKPSELIALHQSTGLGKREFDSLSAFFSNYLYYNLEMSYQGKDIETKFAGDPALLTSMITYLTTEFSQNINLRYERKIISPIDFIYQRSYGAPVSNCLVVFPMPQADRYQITVNGNVLGFNTQTFEFERSDLESAPHLTNPFL